MAARPQYSRDDANNTDALPELHLPSLIERSPFPLAFTPFEFYYLLENRPGYPSAFPIRLASCGPLDRGALSRAWEMVQVRHPLLAANIEYDPRGWPYWVRGERAAINWPDNDIPAAVPELASMPGVKLHIRQQGEKAQWEFTFHHCAVDGMGAFGFITDLLVAYAHVCQDKLGPPPWRKLSSDSLKDRDGHQLFKRRVKLADVLRILAVTLPINYQRAAVVSDQGRLDPPTRPEAVVYTDLVHHLTEHETAELSRVAGALSVMLNDLLLRDYFLTLADWNRATVEARRPLRVLIPTNMRRREDYRLPAANVFSYAFLSRKLRDCKNRESLLASIRDEMLTIKRLRRGLYFEAGLRIFCIWPALLRFSLNRSWTFATAIFSNLGTGLDNMPFPESDGRRLCGNLVLEGGSGAAPIRPATRVSIATHTYAGRLGMCLRCDPQVFSAEQQQRLLDSYVARLRQTIASKS